MSEATVDARATGVLALVRVLQLHVLVLDAEATPVLHRAAKDAAVSGLLESYRRWTGSLATPFDGLSRLTSIDAVRDEVTAVVPSIANDLSADDFVQLAIELTAGTQWPRGVAWELDRAELLATALGLLDDKIGKPNVTDIEGKLRRAGRRLRRDSTSLPLQLTFGAAVAGATAASGGLLTGVGTALGTHLFGLTGMAATTAGLAALGGGNGGFGLAGGRWLIRRSAGDSEVALALARASSAGLVDELAKLDVSVQFNPTQLAEVETGLESLKQELAAELSRSVPSAGQRWESVGGQAEKVLRDPVNTWAHLRGAVAELPDGTERSLRASIRAIDFELRHLRSSGVRRLAQTGLRFIGTPSADKLLDKLPGPS